MEWSEALTKEPIYLNLGGDGNCHPRAGYENYISVDINPPNISWGIKHDLRTSMSLPDNSVTRILTEDFLEHITWKENENLLIECFRLLKPEGIMRIGIPDYNNPKDKPYLIKKNDPRFPGHITLMNYKSMRNLIEKSPFSRYKFYHYWNGDDFIHEEIDYSLGMIKRTPDNDSRSRRIGLYRNITGICKDFLYIFLKGFRFSMKDLLVQKGHRLYVTSLVVDLFKD
jgi:predicted SAM-dependent methyltransferase